MKKEIVKMDFSLYNSLSKKQEIFKPLSKGKVSLYVCGITPYDITHLGHAFTYIFFDILVRFLKFKGYEISYTQNVTDINDRDKDILESARKQNISWRKLADFWTEKFLSNMKALNWISPTYYVKASDSMDKMFDLIKKLLAKKLAYTKNGSVYLDISKFPNYGRLSGLNKKQMLRVASDFEEDLDNPNKKNKLDTTLWRGSSSDQPVHIPSFDSPFGPGRPGWHIECSAMAISTLGEQIDIHGGCEDLKFPHHESEIVQSEGATGKIPFAKFWIHTAEVHYKGAKISKSKGNLVMVSDILKKYSANAIRFMLLSNNYRKPWEFYEKDILKAEEKIKNITRNFDKGKKEDFLLWREFEKHLGNDLDTPNVLKLIEKASFSGFGSFAKKSLEILGFVF